MQCVFQRLVGSISRPQNGLHNILSVMSRKMSSESEYRFETLKVTKPTEHVYQVEVNRPEKRNAMNQAFWREMVECFNKLAIDKECRSVVLSGAGKVFTAGVDLMDLAGVLMSDQELEASRRAQRLKNVVESFQESFTVIEKCPKPVIAAIHSACVGGGVDMVTACDIRMCTQDAWFQVKEVDVGLAADVGTLQRLPKIIGSDSLARELCYTARKLYSGEAKECGLVSSVYDNKENLLTAAINLASEIASKSPVAVQGTKINMVYSRDHSVTESLHYIAVWNQLMLQSEDLMTAAMASMQKEKPTFKDL